MLFPLPLQAKVDIPVYYSPRALIANYDWNQETAYKIMMCESSASTTIVNNNPLTGDYSVGLFQINIYQGLAKSRPSEEELKKAEVNVAYAYKLYSSGGWNHWRNCLNT